MLSQSINAQKPSYKYFNQIGAVEVLNANNSVIDVKQANQVLFKISLIPLQFLIADYKQFQDSSGKWITFFTLIDTSQLISDLNLIFKFDKPVIGSTKIQMLGKGGLAQVSTSFNEEKTMAQFRGSVSAHDGVMIGFLSNEKITAEIKGVAGIYKP